MILEARSPYFRGLLGSSMAEAREGRLVIRELLPPVVRAVLHFIYTGACLCGVGAAGSYVSSSGQGARAGASRLVPIISGIARTSHTSHTCPTHTIPTQRTQMSSPMSCRALIWRQRWRSTCWWRLICTRCVLFTGSLFFRAREGHLQAAAGNRRLVTRACSRLYCALLCTPQLGRLRRICERRLCETVDVETVATTLALAEQNHAEELKRVCLDFVSRNLAQVRGHV